MWTVLVPVAVGALIALLLGVLTPVGPWLTTRVLKLVGSGAGWELSVADHTGSFATGFALHGVRAGSEADDIRVQLERLEVSLWDRALFFVAPDISVDIAPTEPTPPDTAAPGPAVRLPVQYLPDMRLTDGMLRLRWMDSGQRLELAEVAARYTALADDTGSLELDLPAWTLHLGGGEPVRGQLNASVELASSRVVIDTLVAGVTLDTLRAELAGRGHLLLESGYPLEAALDVSVHSDSRAITSRTGLEAAGQLAPLNLRLDASGEAQTPLSTPITWNARARADEQRLSLDTLDAAVLGGRLSASGAYGLQADSASVRVTGRDLGCADLWAGLDCGPMDLRLEAAAELGAERYDVEGALILHDLVLGAAAPLTVRADLRHGLDGATRLVVSGPIGRVEINGTFNPAAGLDPGEYDLALDGQVETEPWLGAGAAPLGLSGRLQGGEHQVRLTTAHIPGQLGEGFGPLALDLHLRDHRQLDARLSLEQQQLQAFASADLAEERLDTLVATLTPLALGRVVAGLEGFARGRVRAGGSWTDSVAGAGLHARGSVDLDGVAYGDWCTGPVRLKVAYGGQRLRADLEGSGLAVEAWVDSELNLDVTGRFRGAMLYSRSDATAGGGSSSGRSGAETATQQEHPVDTAAADQVPARSPAGEGRPADSTAVLSMTGQATWRGPLQEPGSAVGRLDLESVRLTQQNLVVRSRAPVEIDWERGTLRVERMDLDTPVGPLTVKGSARADSLAVRAQVPAVDWGRLMPGWAATGAADLQVSGSAAVPCMEGSVTLNDIRLDSLNLGSVRGRLTFDDSLMVVLALEQGRAQRESGASGTDVGRTEAVQDTGAARGRGEDRGPVQEPGHASDDATAATAAAREAASGAGKSGQPAVQVTVRAPAAPFRRMLWGGGEGAGEAGASAFVSGTGAAAAQAAGMRTGHVAEKILRAPAVSRDSSAKAAPGESPAAAAEAVSQASPEDEIDASGKTVARAVQEVSDTQGPAPERITLELAARQADLGAALTHVLHQRASGYLAMEGAISIPVEVLLGSLAGSEGNRPERGGARRQRTQNSGSAGSAPPAGGRTGKGAGSGTAGGSGNRAVGAGAAGAARSSRQTLPGGALWNALEGRISITGLHVETQVNGTPVVLDMVPGAAIVGDVHHLALRELQMVMLRYDRDLERNVGAGSLRLDGALYGNAPSRLDLMVEKLDLRTFGGQGTAQVRAQVRGTQRRPEVDVALDVETEGLGMLRARLDGDRNGGTLAARWTTQLGDSLVVRGSVPWDAAAGRPDLDAGTMSIRSDRLDLHALSDLVADLTIDELVGVLTADVQVSGLGPDASLNGQVGVRDLSVKLADIEPAYGFPQGRLVFADRQMELADFQSPKSGKRGGMHLSGHIDLTRLDAPEYEIYLRTEDLRLEMQDIFRTNDIDMQVSMTGTTAGARLGGEVRISKALAEPVLVTFNAPPVPPPPATLRDPFLENTELALAVDIRDLEVDSELAQANASGALHIGGTFYKPVFQGHIEIEEGSVFVVNREFAFERGRIVLNSLVPTRSLLDVAYDPLILDPELDMTASSSVIDRETQQEYQVQLNVRGTAQNPSPEFTAIPALDFNSIFRLLAFGSTESRLEYSAALGTAAGQLLSKQVEKVGLDEFTVLPSGSVIGTVGLTTLRMGKYFDKIFLPVWVHYEAPISQMSAGEVRLEHRLTSYLTLSGMAHSTYDRYGLGLGLKKEY